MVARLSGSMQCAATQPWKQEQSSCAGRVGETLALYAATLGNRRQAGWLVGLALMPAVDSAPTSAGDFHLETLKVASPSASFSAAAPPNGDALTVERSAASVNGGSSFSGPLTAEPEVVTHTLAADDEFLLLGCDGGCRGLGTLHAASCCNA